MGRNSELNQRPAHIGPARERRFDERKTGFEPATLTLAKWGFSSVWFLPVP